ncbi:molecular chaperone DnaJ [Neosynechococcus sphagnicola sy1]|uniref:Molecular chaperone DnaJ n=1 Tax=Neosynechococcus sphagnicola sy1 TaxID=1497020 RepID=A0A098TM23_9CYAN|nr:DnaJ C-terminal domain-containing protein [Neosynechococcus sphagnicola]KGF73365.1 molecular chaperone DnaJ [Neosynechococcus sphagnicola sy1]
MAATDFKDYYAILGVGKTAHMDEIKQAYRRLARKYHPDMNPGDQEAETQFKTVNEAYEVLSDPEKRQKYDQFGRYWKQADQGGTPWSSQPGAGVDFENLEFGQYANFDEFINQLLGRFGSPGPSPGQRSHAYRTPQPTGSGFGGFSGYEDRMGISVLDREASLALSLAEAFHGVQKRLDLGNESIEVRIPPGAKPGSRIRVRGKGASDPYTHQRGDLYLMVQIQPHAFFQFEADTLVCEVPITPDEAVLGAQVEIPTPDGIVKMQVPAGIRSGQSLRLRGKGWPRPKDGRGDQLVRIVILAPKELSSVERVAYETIQANRTFHPRTHLKQIHL